MTYQEPSQTIWITDIQHPHPETQIETQPLPEKDEQTIVEETENPFQGFLDKLKTSLDRITTEIKVQTNFLELHR